MAAGACISRRLVPNICVTALLVIFCLPSYSYGTVRGIADVFLNHENKGSYFFILTDEGKILLSPEDLLKMGIQEIPEGAETGEEGYIYVDSLLPEISSSFDEKASVLYLTADPALSGTTTIDLYTTGRQGRVLHAGVNSAFLNYGLTYTAENGFDFTSLAIPLEMGLRSDGYLALSNFSYVKTGTDEKFVRLMSSIIRDDTMNLRRVILGDFSAYSGLLGSGGSFGGLSISKNFTIDPYLLRYPGLDIYGAVRNPSDVEIYVNDHLVKREHLLPGEFQFLNMTNLNGAGDAVLVIRDAFGTEERMIVPYYVSTALLKPGLHDYSYNLGFRREALGYKSFRYGSPAFLGFHRYGFSRGFTGGFRAEADKDVINAGPTATFLLGRLGEMDTAMAFSCGDGKAGFGFSASYFRAGSYLSGRLAARGYSRDYANLSIAGFEDKARLEVAASLGFRQKFLGSISFTYSSKDMYEGTDIKREAVYYNRTVARNVSLYVRTARTDAEERSYEIFAGLTFLFGHSMSGNVSYSKEAGTSTIAATLQQNPPLGRGFGYRIGLGSEDNGHTTAGDAYLQYRGDYGIYSAEYRKTGEQDSYTFSASGGIAFVNNSAYFARPVTDGFALVKVNLENVRVNYSNQEVGTTGKSGDLLIPGLISYHDNDISINDKDIPVNYEIKEVRKLISVPYRGGGVVSFDLRRLQGFTGRLFISEKGRRTEAEYWGYEIRMDGKVEKGIVGKKGEFYFENFPAGRFPARLFTKDRECSFEISIPKSDETMVDMGEVTCEMD